MCILGIEVLNQLEVVIVRFTKEFLNRSIWTWSILLIMPLIRYIHMIADCSENINLIWKKKFMEWLHSNLKDNSPLLTKGQYNEIIKYLKADDKSAFLRKIRRRVASNNYQLTSFPVLGMEDILCGPPKIRLDNLLFPVLLRLDAIAQHLSFLPNKCSSNIW